MGRGPTIQAKKEKNAQEKAKTYTLHAKLISLAAEKGSDIEKNRSLEEAIRNAKKDGVNSEVIDRAIKRGAGLDSASSRIEEIFYEGYAPGGVGVIVRTLSDNRNRTTANIRHIFSSYGGSLGESGTISHFAFDYRGIIIISDFSEREKLEYSIMETPASDYLIESERAIIYTEKIHFIEVKNILEKSGFPIEKSFFGYIPKGYREIADTDIALKIYTMLEEFDNDEDVEAVWHNAHISDDLWRHCREERESRKFRT